MYETIHYVRVNNGYLNFKKIHGTLTKFFDIY